MWLRVGDIPPAEANSWLPELPLLFCNREAHSVVFSGGAYLCSEFSSQNQIEISELVEEEVLGLFLGL